MQAFAFGCYVSLLTSSLLAYAYATVGGQYSVNVHFVPPLVTASCQVAQFWTPPNVTCALCFCMTGTLSRCIPQPGCNPQSQNSSTSQPDNSTTTEGNGSASSTTSQPIDAQPPANSPEGDSTTTEASQSASTGATSSPSKIRAAKPGKSRRRRHSNQVKSDAIKI